MKRILALLLLLPVAAGIFCGCIQEKDPYTPTGDALDSGQTQQPTQLQTEVPLALAYYPERSMDPFVTMDPSNRQILNLIYQGLFAIDEGYEVVPVLCGGYRVSRDMRTYTFYLTQGATFSDGTTVIPEDVAASLEKARTSAVYSARLTHVLSVTALEDGGIEVVTDTPCENLPLLLDIPIVKADQIEEQTPLGTGPYALEETISGLRLRRRTIWWCESKDLLATANYIPLTAAEKTVDVRDSFEAQKTTMVCMDPGNPTYADFRCDYELWDCDSGYMLYLALGGESTVFSHPSIRQALTYAIDRDYLVDTYYQGFAQATPLPASPDSPYYSKKLADRYSYNPAALKEAIQNAGMEGAQITFLLNSDNAVRLRVGREIARMLENCGLVVNLLELPQKEFLIYVEWAEYDMYLGQTKLSANMDISPFFGEKGAMSYGGMEDPALYAMSLEALANSGNYYDLHRMVAEDGRLCPILFRRYAVYTQRGMLSQLTSVRDNLFPYSIGVSMEDILLQENA